MKRRLILGGVGVLALLIALVAARKWRSELRFTLAPTRGVEARLPVASLDKHRPYAAGADAGLKSVAARAQGALAAGLWLLGGEPEKARPLVASAQDDASAGVRVAVELVAGNAQAALSDADALLVRHADDTRALWNRALARVALGLPLSAAADLEAVAARGEPGWADEARTRAEALKRPVAERVACAKRVNQFVIGPAEAAEPEVKACVHSARTTLRMGKRMAPTRADSFEAFAQRLDTQLGGSDDRPARLLAEVQATLARGDRAGAFTRAGELLELAREQGAPEMERHALELMGQTAAAAVVARSIREELAALNSL